MSGCRAPGQGDGASLGSLLSSSEGAASVPAKDPGVSGSASSSRAPPDSQPRSYVLCLDSRGPRSQRTLYLVCSGRQEERVLRGRLTWGSELEGGWGTGAWPPPGCTETGELHTLQ